jgi:acylglycerol lipase
MLSNRRGVIATLTTLAALFSLQVGPSSGEPGQESISKAKTIIAAKTTSQPPPKAGAKVKKPGKTSKTPTRLRIEVPCRAWTPATPPKVVLLCVHGLGLNSRSYEPFGQRMAKLGIATFAVDVRGFGTWMQVKGKEQVDFNSCLSDVEQAIKTIHTAYPKTPVFILGESMGGAIALRFTANHPEMVNGLISSVPSGDRFNKTRQELGVALRIITGRINKPMDVGSKVIQQATDDLAVREQWKDDPFNRLQLTPSELMQFQKFMNENHDSAKQIDKTPVLVIAGFKDKLVKPEGTIELFNELTTPDKLLVVVGSGEHLIFEENQLTDQVTWVVLGWLKSHIEGG